MRDSTIRQHQSSQQRLLTWTLLAVSYRVGTQVLLGSESPSALGLRTDELLLVGMRCFVTRQIRLLDEALAADLTNERSLSGVQHLVASQAKGLREAGKADVAFVFPFFLLYLRGLECEGKCSEDGVSMIDDSWRTFATRLLNRYDG